jgi:4,5-dihydroxyphthalate decarboxylase
VLNLSLALSNCDRHSAFFDGSQRVEGVALRLIMLPVQEIFNRQMSSFEFDCSEVPIATYIRLAQRPDCPLVAIPVFPSRFFRHSCIFVNVNSGIEKPQDLRGKRVGVPVFDMAAALWVRGIFQDDYGLDPRSVIYLTGGLDEPRAHDAHPQIYPAGFDVRPIGGADSLSNLLARGEIDALVTAKAPNSFFAAKEGVRRLFPDYRTVELDYFRRTGIFPIMHTVALRRAVYEANPWLAVNLYKAFDAAHQRALRAIIDTTALSTALPWLTAEAESTVAAMGERFWPSGIEPNRACLEKVVLYTAREGLIEKPVDIDGLFAPETVKYLKTL